MGTFYGSIHVRGQRPEAVRAALEALAETKEKPRFLLGPLQRDWVAVYPSGAGQDLGLSAKLARRLGGVVLHLLLHDSDVVHLVLYRDGKQADAYCSDPDYFEEVSPAARKKVRGQPARVASLLGLEGQEEHLAKVFTEGADGADGDETFARLASALGVPDAAASYESLREEGDLTPDKRQALVPVPALDPREVQAQQTRAALAELARAGVLLATPTCEGARPGGLAPDPVLTPGKGGDFLLAWSHHASEPEQWPLERWGLAGPARREPLRAEHPWSVLALALSPSGAHVAVSSGRVRLLDVASGEEVAELGGRGVSWLAFTPDGEHLVGRGSEGLLLWTLRAGTPPVTVPVPGDGRGAALSADGTLAAVCGGSGLSVVEVPSGRVLEGFDVPRSVGVFGLAFAAEGRLLVAATSHGLRAYDWSAPRPAGAEPPTPRAWREEAARAGAEGSSELRFVLDARHGRLLACTARGELLAVDPTSGRVLQRVTPPGQTPLLSVALSEDGEVLATVERALGRGSPQPMVPRFWRTRALLGG
jgi:hypothetical protein